jgi:hypothetical protein
MWPDLLTKILTPLSVVALSGPVLGVLLKVITTWLARNRSVKIEIQSGDRKIQVEALDTKSVESILSALRKVEDHSDERTR